VEGELKFRLSSTCSKLLGQTRPQREKIYDRMRLAYDIRSSVVHSGKIGSKLEKRLKNAGLQLPELISQLEGYLYDSFNIFIKNPEKRETLDMLLLS